MASIHDTHAENIQLAKTLIAGLATLRGKYDRLAGAR